MLYHGEAVLPLGYGATDATYDPSKLTGEQKSELAQAGIVGGSQIAAALISVFGSQALTKQQQQYALTQQRTQQSFDLAMAKLGLASGGTPTGTTPAPTGYVAPPTDYTPLLLIAGLGLVAFLVLRNDGKK